MIGIYIIKSLISNKVYIGSSKNVYRRMSVHKRHLKLNKHVNTHLQNHYNKYGEIDFIFEIIEFCEEDLLCSREEYWINYYKSNIIGFNITSFINGRNKMSLDTKLKISKSHIGKKRTFTEEWSKNISLSNKGRKLKDNHKENIRKSKQGVRREPFNKDWILKMTIARTKCFDIYFKNGDLYKSNINTIDIAKEFNCTRSSVLLCYKKGHVLNKSFLITKVGELLDITKFNRKSAKVMKTSKTIVMSKDNMIKEFPSIKIASDSLGIKYASIVQSIRKGGLCSGWKAEYKKN